MKEIGPRWWHTYLAPSVGPPNDYNPLKIMVIQWSRSRLLNARSYQGQMERNPFSIFLKCWLMCHVELMIRNSCFQTLKPGHFGSPLVPHLVHDVIYYILQVFHAKHMRSSATTYLTALAFADSMYLLCACLFYSPRPLTWLTTDRDPDFEVRLGDIEIERRDKKRDRQYCSIVCIVYYSFEVSLK